MIDSVCNVIGVLLVVCGLAFDLLGCLGLVRMPDVYNRLQAATKCVTLGTCSILLGTFLVAGFTATGFKALLAMVFVVLTAPVAAHAIARGGMRGHIPLCRGTVVDAYPRPGLKTREDGS